MSEIGLIINTLSSTHPHFLSLIKEALWGFPDNRINRNKFNNIRENSQALLYFKHNNIRGIWAECRIKEKFINTNPVEYWSENPVGYPLQIRLEFIIPEKITSIKDFDDIKPIKRDELSSLFNIPIFKAPAPADKWSLYLFGEKKGQGITYLYNKFEPILNEFEARNKSIRLTDHEAIKEVIYNIGQIQGKNPAKEYQLDNERIDVVWRKTSRSAPYMAFEIHLHGDLYADLIKLKHAYDIWNSIPVLITTNNKVNEAWRWIKGSLHEIENIFRVITIEDIEKYYKQKRELKDFETKLGLI